VGPDNIYKVVHFIYTWQNPYSGAFPAYDGFDAQFKASIGDNFAAPNLKYEWFVPGDSFTVAGVSTSATVFDTKPAAHDETPAIVDAQTGAAGAEDNIAPPDNQLGQNLCKEIWKYSDTAVGCVLL